MSKKKTIFLSLGILIVIAVVIFLVWFIPNYRRHLKVQEKYGPLPTEVERMAEKYEAMEEHPQVTPEQKEATIKEIEAIAHNLVNGTNDIGEPILPPNEIFVNPEVWDETKYSVTLELYADGQTSDVAIKKKMWPMIGRILKTLYTSKQPIGRVVISVTQKDTSSYEKMVRTELLLLFLTASDVEKAKINWNQDEQTLYFNVLPNTWETVNIDPNFATAQID
ncbi:MAG: hypothetical protein PHW01_01450 [Patescibacteria group bacterium]|nr:hypothetical protein [Patescibacteria group bacterium]